MMSAVLGQLNHSPSSKYLTPMIGLSLKVLESHSSLLHWPALGKYLLITLLGLPVAKLGGIELSKDPTNLLGPRRHLCNEI